jgi:glycerol-3-phosphate dehydrogenase
LLQREFPTEVDLLILGGGITGSTLLSVTSNSGRKTLLVEKNDFASGTSQASGMMVWGGLLYMKNLEFLLVRKYCKSRDWLVKNSASVTPRRFNYLPLAKGGRSSLFMTFVLFFYWILSGFVRGGIRTFPKSNLPESWDINRFKKGISYEEAFLTQSDSQYSFDWLKQCPQGSYARNYCEPVKIVWNAGSAVYDVILRDKIGKRNICFKAKNIVNCCGVWADEVNQQFSIRTKYFHHLSKGVYLLLEKQVRDDALVVDMEENGDTLCWVPWGPTVMWGPTETDLDDLQQIKVDTKDIKFLLDKLNNNSIKKWTEADIKNVRVGVRPLPKLPNQKVVYSLDLSRKAIIEQAPIGKWWSVFGGKLSGGYNDSHKIYKKIFNGSAPILSQQHLNKPNYITHLFYNKKIKCPQWCKNEEDVFFLEDYLRRRTNLAQWISRSGFGRKGEFAEDIYHIALLLHQDEEAANYDYNQYRERVLREEKQWKSQQFWEDLPPLHAINLNLQTVNAGPTSGKMS